MVNSTFPPHASISIAPVDDQTPLSRSPREACKSERIKKAKILIIDDEPLIIRVVRRFLQSSGYVNFATLSDSRKAIETMCNEKPDLVLMDIMMPHVSGIEILREKNRLDQLRYLPVIILSATSDKHTKQEALELGATEFLNKPVDPNDLILRVRNALIVKAHHDHLANQTEELERQVSVRTLQLTKSREQIIHSLAKAAEFRDNETGRHVVRVGKYASLIAAQLGFDDKYCLQIELAAQLHDVGKIGIPDAILLNPGKLSDDEFEFMKRHCQIGCHIIDELVEQQNQHRLISPQTPEDASAAIDREGTLMLLAANIARSHHERWDGTGYPRNISGERIPIEGRITAVADVFDALTSRRPYKKAFSNEDSLKIIIADSGKAFDPNVVKAFLSRIGEAMRIRHELSDDI